MESRAVPSTVVRRRGLALLLVGLSQSCELRLQLCIFGGEGAGYYRECVRQYSGGSGAPEQLGGDPRLGRPGGIYDGGAAAGGGGSYGSGMVMAGRVADYGGGGGGCGCGGRSGPTACQSVGSGRVRGGGMYVCGSRKSRWSMML